MKPGGAELAGVEPGGAEPEGVEHGGAQLEGAESGGAEPWGAALSGGPAGASQRLSPHQLPGAGGAGASAGAGGTGGTAAAGLGGARTRGAGVAGSGGVGGAGAAGSGALDPGAGGSGPPDKAAMDAEMASWKSTGTYVDEVPPRGANIVDGMWIFRRQGVDYFQTFSPTPRMTTLQVLLHIAAQRDYELHSLDFSTAFLQGSLHKEIWLHRPSGFTGTTLAALGFANLSLFLHTDTSLPPFYILVYVDDLVFATADTKALTLVKSELQKSQTCTDLGELHSYIGLQITRDRARCTITLTQSHMVHQVLLFFDFEFSSPQPTPLSTGHSLSAPPSNESIEPSGLYPELVGCLMYLMTCTRLDLAYPLSLLARYVAPATQRSSEGYTFSLGSGSVSWQSTRSSLVLSSSFEAKIHAGAMAAQELRWLTYVLTDLGEQPHSSLVVYVDNKAMIALCQEHKLEHRTKHIALQYFLA
ncbi:unnamed protein product [Closterium sp. NIES-53]